MAFSNTLMPQVLKQYFKKNYATAYGVSLAGISLGTFIAPPVIEWLFEFYGVSGTFLLMGAIIMNSVPIALLFKIMTPKRENDCPYASVQLSKNVHQRDATNVSADKKIILSHKQASVANTEETSTAVWEEKTFDGKNKSMKKTENVSAVNSPTNHVENLPTVQGTSNYECEAISESVIQDSVEYPDIEKQSITYEKLPMNEEKVLEACANTTTHSSVIYSNQLVEIQTSNNAVKISSSVKNLEVIPKSKAAFQSLGIFLDPTFLSIMFTQSSEVFVLYMVSVTMLDYSREKGIARSKEVYFLMVHPIAELFGRLGLCWIVDRHYLSEITFSCIGFALLGLLCMVLSFANDFISFMAGIVLFTIVTTAVVTVFPGIIYKFTEPENQIMALASSFVLLGPMSFAFASFIEYSSKTLGSYDWLYYILTMVSVLCGIFTALTPFFARRRERKRVKKEAIKERSN